VADARGRVLFQARPDAERVLPVATAALAGDVLRGVVDHGTGTRAAIGRPVAGKTGTTQDHADAWFVGFTPQLATAVWVGFPQGALPMRPPRTRITVFGGTWPAEIWSAFMGPALAHRPVEGFPDPAADVVKVAVDLRHNCLRNRFTPSSAVGVVAYLRGEAPRAVCATPAGPLPGVVPATVGLPVAEASSYVARAGFGVRQQLRVTADARPGTVLGQQPPGGAEPKPGTVVRLTVAVTPQGVGGLGVTLVPPVLGQPLATATTMLQQAGLSAVAAEQCPDGPAGPAARPGTVWSADPAPGAQAASGAQVRLRTSPAGEPPCPPAKGTSTSDRPARPG
jgi:penicillin-binding protein 1A